MQKRFYLPKFPMLDFLLGATQNHHPGIFSSLERALCNQFPRQNVIIIAQSHAHRSSNLTSKAGKRCLALKDIVGGYASMQLPA